MFNNTALKRYILFIFLLILVFSESSLAEANRSIKKKENNYLSFSLALFDFIQNYNSALEGRGEFRLYNVPVAVKPLAGFMANTDGALFLYAGLLYDIPISNFLYVTPSFSPGIYFKNGSKDLGFELNFRSQLEISFRFENNFRFGLSFNHISNGTLGKINPGVESLSLSAQFPL